MRGRRPISTGLTCSVFVPISKARSLASIFDIVDRSKTLPLTSDARSAAVRPPCALRKVVPAVREGIPTLEGSSSGRGTDFPAASPLGMGCIAHFEIHHEATEGSSNSAVTPAKAGAHIPEAGVYGPRLFVGVTWKEAQGRASRVMPCGSTQSVEAGLFARWAWAPLLGFAAGAVSLPAAPPLGMGCIAQNQSTAKTPRRKGVRAEVPFATLRLCGEPSGGASAGHGVHRSESALIRWTWRSSVHSLICRPPRRQHRQPRLNLPFCSRAQNTNISLANRNKACTLFLHCPHAWVGLKKGERHVAG